MGPPGFAGETAEVRHFRTSESGTPFRELRKAQQRGLLSELISRKAQPHALGMQVSRGVHSEVLTQDAIRRVATSPRPGVLDARRAERKAAGRRSPHPRPRAHSLGPNRPRSFSSGAGRTPDRGSRWPFAPRPLTHRELTRASAAARRQLTNKRLGALERALDTPLGRELAVFLVGAGPLASAILGFGDLGHPSPTAIRGQDSGQRPHAMALEGEEVAATTLGYTVVDLSKTAHDDRLRRARAAGRIEPRYALISSYD